MGFKKVIADYLGKLSELVSGDTIHPSQLGTGTADSTKFLRGDGTWQVPAGGGGGGITIQDARKQAIIFG